MNPRVTIASALLAAFVASPALANDVIHSANTEMGYTVHPDHAKPGKTRAEVLAEVTAAQKDGTWRYLRVGLPVPSKAQSQRTREEVRAELARAQQDPRWSTRFLDAP